MVLIMRLDPADLLAAYTLPPAPDIIFTLVPFHGASWLTHVRDEGAGCSAHMWFFPLGLRLVL